jgi:DNA-binding Lrp family transcriptional regulator
MVTAIILMRCARQSIVEIAEKLADIESIAEVYSVAGKYDLVAMVRVAHNDDLADLVTRRMRDVTGIEETETLIAFRAYSKHDLESLFSVGM